MPNILTGASPTHLPLAGTGGTLKIKKRRILIDNLSVEVPQPDLKRRIIDWKSTSVRARVVSDPSSQYDLNTPLNTSIENIIRTDMTVTIDKNEETTDSFLERYLKCVESLLLAGLPTTARVIFDAFIMTINPETVSTDSKIQVLLGDAEVQLLNAGISLEDALESYAQCSSQGNSEAHSVTVALARQQLEAGEAAEGCLPISKNSIRILQKLLNMCRQDSGMIRGVYRNWDNSTTVSNARLLREGRKFLKSMGNDDSNKNGDIFSKDEGGEGDMPNEGPRMDSLVDQGFSDNNS